MGALGGGTEESGKGGFTSSLQVRPRYARLDTERTEQLR
jgi:hypothetical protein